MFMLYTFQKWFPPDKYKQLKIFQWKRHSDEGIRVINMQMTRRKEVKASLNVSRVTCNDHPLVDASP